MKKERAWIGSYFMSVGGAGGGGYLVTTQESPVTLKEIFDKSINQNTRIYFQMMLQYSRETTSRQKLFAVLVIFKDFDCISETIIFH
jgi:hypothetical protein